MGTAPPLLGRTVAGRFEIRQRLGEGAMAVVYRGIEQATGRAVAVKVLHGDLSRDPSLLRRFQREAAAAAAIRHPNSVEIIDAGVDGALAFMVMELLEGRNLDELVAAEGHLPEARAALIVAEMCDALDAAHRMGVIHRDLKPDNVMVSEDPHFPGRDRVKVLDFGIAKVMEDSPDSRQSMEETNTALTTVGMILGTPEYMSPEQCHGSTIDARSDVYACGVVLYHLVTGSPPFRGPDPLHTMLMQVRDAPAPPRLAIPSLSLAVEALILSALEKDPERRPQTARELLDRLLDLPALQSSRQRFAPPLPAVEPMLPEEEPTTVDPPSEDEEDEWIEPDEEIESTYSGEADPFARTEALPVVEMPSETKRPPRPPPLSVTPPARAPTLPPPAPRLAPSKAPPPRPGTLPPPSLPPPKRPERPR